MKAVLMSWLPSNNRVSSGGEILTTSCRCALQVLEQWESQQGQSSPAQTSLSAPVIPHSAPFPTHHLHRASVPDSASEALALAKPDPFDLYEKSRAIYESRRKYRSWNCRCSDKKDGTPHRVYSLSQTNTNVLLLLHMSRPLSIKRPVAESFTRQFADVAPSISPSSY